MRIHVKCEDDDSCVVDSRLARPGTTYAMKCIVVSFDESEQAERALTRAADLAEAFAATLVVTAVAVPPVPGPGVDALLPGTSERFASEATEELDLADQHLERARRLLEGRAARSEFVSQAGAPAEQILELAEQRQADLIVVGVREPGFLERLLEGSVAEDVAHRTRRDGLIVH
jgi:nucleotide-binding universal stress UspA family protein